MKIRECKMGCGYPALKGRQFCLWHALRRMSPDGQAHAARQRLAAVPEAERRARVPVDGWPDGERWCAGCQSFVPLFYCTGSRCRACASASAHSARVQKTYGISSEQYDQLLEKQGGRCAICRNRPQSIRLAVDHDHQTGAVRGLLCKRCNHDLLGGGHDDVFLLWRAITYLLFPPSDERAVANNETVLAAMRERLAFDRNLRRRSRPAAEDPPF